MRLQVRSRAFKTGKGNCYGSAVQRFRQLRLGNHSGIRKEAFRPETHPSSHLKKLQTPLFAARGNQKKKTSPFLPLRCLDPRHGPHLPRDESGKLRAKRAVVEGGRPGRGVDGETDVSRNVGRAEGVDQADRGGEQVGQRAGNARAGWSLDQRVGAHHQDCLVPGCVAVEVGARWRPRRLAGRREWPSHAGACRSLFKVRLLVVD